MAESNIIWRYLDLSKFIGLLSRGLHFTRPHALGDKWEGTWGGKNVLRFREEYFGRPDAGAQEWQSRLVEKKRLLDGVGVSCWHQSECESAALWELYMPKGLGVAVQSTSTRVASAIAAIGRDVEVLKVRYIDFEAEEIPSDPSVLLACKRVEFRHENEVRFLIRFSEDELSGIALLERAYGEREVRWISLSPINGGLIRPGHGIAVTDRTAVDRSTPVGVHLRVPALSVIEKVYLAPLVPAPMRYAVLDIATKYGLDPSVICESSKDMIAPDRLKFFP